MALDLYAIATALAAKYAGLTPPSGLPAIKLATATPPNNVIQTPSVLVFPPDGVIVYGAGQRDGDTHHDFVVHLLLARSQADLVRETTTLLRWIGVMLDATHLGSSLGLAPIVAKAIPVAYASGVLDYGGIAYESLSVTVRVWTRDTVVLVP